MTITGQFRDLKNNLISVEIFNPSPEGDYPIDDYFYTDNNNPYAGHFAFDGKSPIKITRKNDDLFNPIFSTSCKIKLRSNIWCGDLLFADGVGSIICKVERQKHNQQTGQDSLTKDLLFVGYVKPLSFNQNINQATNIIDINCVDLLGFLKDKYLSTGLQPQSETAWKQAISMAQYRTFPQILEKIGIYNTEFDFSNTTLTTKMYIQREKDMSASNLNISDNLWLGESSDDETSMSDILVELMKYLNCRIVSINGLDYYIIDNSTNTSITGMYYYVGSNKTWVDFSNTGTLPKQDIANEQVTIDSCYNKIGIKCELDTIDDVVSSPLKDEMLSSPYINKQLMLREYIGNLEVGDYDYYHDFCHMVMENNFVHVTSDKVKFKDWYFRYLDNSGWIYNNNMMNNEFLPAMPYKNSNNYIWQCRMLHDLGYVMSHTPNTASINRPYNDSLGGAYFVAIGDSGDYTKNDNSPKGNISTTNYLVIPVKGLDRGNSTSNESIALAEYASLLYQYNSNPMISYSSGKAMNLSPADTQTTNYIILSGKLRCMPVYQTNDDEGRTMGLLRDWTYDYDFVKDDLDDDLDEGDIMPAHLPTGDDGERAYYARFFDLQTPNQTVNMNGESIPPNVNASNTVLMFPPQDVKGLYRFQYRYNQITPTSGSYYDNLTHVPILCCRLYVTNAEGKRKYVNQDPQTFAFSWTEWVDSSDATFCISINPKIDDFIIGPEHEITNTVTSAMNLKNSGLAIPIKQADDVHGNLTFEILGPYNTQYDDVNKRTHSKWTQFWRGENPEDWTTTPRCLLDRISNIWISKFEITVDSDNAKNSTLNSGDLLYYSEDNKKYNNVKDNIEFKIVTALTNEEAANLNIATGISFNNPTDSGGNLYTTSYEDRPECNYINTMYDLYSTPKKLVEYTCNDDTPIDEIYRSIYSCDLMSHLNVGSFNSIVLANEMDLKNNRIKITLREV